jgi:CelD/BcsL family acetyltransferase involved in cellulose biosynthesis
MLKAYSALSQLSYLLPVEKPLISIHVEVIRDVARLADVAAPWNALSAAALDPNPSYESWMLVPALRALESDADVECVLVWSQCGLGAALRLDGVFPFRRLSHLRGMPARVLSSWCHHSFPLGTPMLRADCAADCLRALFEWLAHGYSGASAIEFRYVPDDSVFYRVLKGVLRERRLTATATTTFTRAFLRKAEDAEHYLKRSLSADDRKSLRRRERRLGELGTVTHVAMGPRDDPERWLDDLFSLEASGWKGRQGGAFACSAPQRRFALETLTAAHARGRLQIVGIDLDGKPVSRCSTLIAGASAYAYRTAYDEAYAAYSPGIIAHIDAIRAFHELPQVHGIDSLTAPDNAMLNRLWRERLTLHAIVIGTALWGESCVSLLPILQRAKQAVKRNGRKQS